VDGADSEVCSAPLLVVSVLLMASRVLDVSVLLVASADSSDDLCSDSVLFSDPPDAMAASSSEFLESVLSDFLEPLFF